MKICAETPISHVTAYSSGSRTVWLQGTFPQSWNSIFFMLNGIEEYIPQIKWGHFKTTIKFESGQHKIGKN